MINLNEYISICNKVTESVIFVDDNYELKYYPELKEFYLLYFINATLHEAEAFVDEDNNVDMDKAFSFVISNKEGIIEEAGRTLYNMLLNGVNEKIEEKKNRYYNVPATPSLCDVALESLFKTIEEKIMDTNNIVESVGKENLTKLITDMSKKKFTEANVVKAMQKNGVI